MRRRLVVCAAAVAIAAMLGATSRSAAPRFLSDDPLWVDDDSVVSVGKIEEVEDGNGFDFLINTFGNVGERRDVRALNVNTVDEVRDSSWFTNRMGRQPMSVADVVKGPDRIDRISFDGWVVSGGKGSGRQPGFRMTDPSGQLYQVEVDPPSNPEMASAAEIIGTAFYHAFGYHVVEVYVAELDASTLVISEKATLRDELNGQRRRMTRRDVDRVLEQSARQPNGRYRVIVSRFASGRPLGNFRYYGTRPDDPNDIVAHEHRRELRGARVFGAWLNHDDSRGVNSLNMLETTDGRSWIKHYMFDFGSILGSGTVHAQVHRAGNEYIFEQRPGWVTLATFGLYLRPWMRISYPRVPPSVGRIEADSFDPVSWKPEYPNTAFDNMRPDDAFWAARIVSRFSDAHVRAVVEKAQYSDPQATDYVTQVIIKRRDKVVATWLNVVNPVVNPTLQADGTLTFENAAVEARAAQPGEGYTLQWFRFDNSTDQASNVGEAQTTTTMTSRAPDGLLTSGEYVGVTITGRHPQHPDWSRPARFYFRRGGASWQLVGAER